MCDVQSHYGYDEFDQFTLDDVDAAFDRITQVKYHQSVNMRGEREQYESFCNLFPW